MCRIGRGIWRRGAETPMAVKWEDRSIEVREGSWSYIASTSSVGYAPGKFSRCNVSFLLSITTVNIWVFILLHGTEKVVGTATPMKDQQGNKVVWRFSTGDILTIGLGDDLIFELKDESSEEEVSLVISISLSPNFGQKQQSL